MQPLAERLRQSGVAVTSAGRQPDPWAMPPWRCPMAAWPASAPRRRPAQSGAARPGPGLRHRHPPRHQLVGRHQRQRSRPGGGLAAACRPEGNRGRRPARPGGAAYRGDARQRGRRCRTARCRQRRRHRPGHARRRQLPLRPAGLGLEPRHPHTLRVLDNLQRSYGGAATALPAVTPLRNKGGTLHD